MKPFPFPQTPEGRGFLREVISDLTEGMNGHMFETLGGFDWDQEAVEQIRRYLLDEAMP